MQVGSVEAKTNFSALLDRVEQGEEVTITRRGKAIARLVPAESEGERLARQARAVEELKKIAESNRGKGITPEEIKAWIEEGRR